MTEITQRKEKIYRKVTVADYFTALSSLYFIYIVSYDVYSFPYM